MRRSDSSASAKHRALSFYREVSPFFSSYFDSDYRLVEFCAGNGNGSRIFFDMGDVISADIVDIKETSDLLDNLAAMQDHAHFFLGDARDYSLSKGDIAVIAVHACGELTDMILEKAVAACCPVAVMPCCYNQDMRQIALSVLLIIEDFFMILRRIILTHSG